MTILVTGAAGFIGAAVCEALLARGEKVLGIDNLNSYYDPKLKQMRLMRLNPQSGFDFVETDIADAEALDATVGSVKISGIIHLGSSGRRSVFHRKSASLCGIQPGRSRQHARTGPTS